MPRKRHKPEEIVAKQRQVDVLVSQGDRPPRSGPVSMLVHRRLGLAPNAGPPPRRIFGLTRPSAGWGSRWIS